jgi:hypothetical protein
MRLTKQSLLESIAEFQGILLEAREERKSGWKTAGKIGAGVAGAGAVGGAAYRYGGGAHYAKKAARYYNAATNERVLKGSGSVRGGERFGLFGARTHIAKPELRGGAAKSMQLGKEMEKKAFSGGRSTLGRDYGAARGFLGKVARAAKAKFK